MSRSVNLWPDDWDIPEEMPPGILLREQAKGLGERTLGRVEAEVFTQPLSGDRLEHTLQIKATELGGYVHPLLYLTHKKKPALSG